jgi:hypothetical protein
MLIKSTHHDSSYPKQAVDCWLNGTFGEELLDQLEADYKLRLVPFLGNLQLGVACKGATQPQIYHAGKETL